MRFAVKVADLSALAAAINTGNLGVSKYSSLLVVVTSTGTTGTPNLTWNIVDDAGVVIQMVQAAIPGVPCYGMWGIGADLVGNSPSIIGVNGPLPRRANLVLDSFGNTHTSRLIVYGVYEAGP